MLVLAFIVGLAVLPMITFFTLEQLSQIATIVASFAVIIAYLDYRERKKREQTLTVTDQLNFFRTEILPISETIGFDEEFDDRVIRITKPIKDLSYGALYKEYKDIILKQQEVCKSKKIENTVIKLFNALEEFSWKVILNQTEEDLALRVVHESYVQFVEFFTYRIGINRDYSQNQFEGINMLYKKWAPLISRETVDERVDRVVKRVTSS